MPCSTADLSSGECCVERSCHTGDYFREGLWRTENDVVLPWPARELLCCTGTICKIQDVNSIFMYILEDLNVAFV